MNYVFDNVYTIRIKITNDKWINVHNVYNVSFNFYMTRNALIIIENEFKQSMLNQSIKLNYQSIFNFAWFWNFFKLSKIV
jgi:hypothetical protein